jgi:branched-chain amino acid transport system ATP-binding protein
MSFKLGLKDLSSGYGDIVVIKNISLSVKEGCIVAVLGPNGAGKTTLLHTIMGLTKIYSGKILYNSYDISALKTWERVEKGIALVPEGRRIFPELTVYENLITAAMATKRGKKTLDENLKLVYETFPRLKERASQKAGTLSGGEQQMLAIGRALMNNPELLLLDEYSQGLAPSIVNEISKKLVELKETKKLTILVAEQQISRIINLSDEIYVIEFGVIVKHGTFEELYKELKNLYIG